MIGALKTRARRKPRSAERLPPVGIAVLLSCFLLAGCSEENNSGKPGPLLSEITDSAGLGSTKTDWPAGLYRIPEISAGGVGIFDIDGDGMPELYQVRYPAPGKFSEAAPNRLYRRDKVGTYHEVPGAGGLNDPGYGNGVAVGDIDNDGDLDVYVTNIGLSLIHI